MAIPTTIDWIDDMDLSVEDTFIPLAGIDEAGRGPLAGPIIAAAVILDPRQPVSGLADSKTLSAKKREYLATIIRQRALAYGLGRADLEEIDRLNVLGATMLAMQRAVSALEVAPRYILIDGQFCPALPCPATAIVQGDKKVPAISAASILAKVSRDREMMHLDTLYPAYGFAKHKGYPTRAHIRALFEYGPSPCHRRNFAPVKNALIHKQVKRS